MAYSLPAFSDFIAALAKRFLKKIESNIAAEPLHDRRCDLCVSLRAIWYQRIQDWLVTQTARRGVFCFPSGGQGFFTDCVARVLLQLGTRMRETLVI